MINKKTSLKIGILLVSIILITSCISAFAVSSAYWKENPLRMYPGETKDIGLILQNMPGPEDINARGEITSGANIAKLMDEEYFVPFGGKTEVNIRISIPKDAQIDEKYEAVFSFTTIPGEDADTLGFGSSIEKIIPITIIEKPTKPKITGEAVRGEEGLSWTTYLAIAILLIIIITFFLFVRKRAKEERKKSDKFK